MDRLKALELKYKRDIFLLTLSNLEQEKLSRVSSWEQMKYCFKQMDKNFWIVSVSSDPLEDIWSGFGPSRPPASPEQNSRTTTASNSEVMTVIQGQQHKNISVVQMTFSTLLR